MAESWQNLQKWERLKWAREGWGARQPGLRAGTATDAAKKLGLEPGTYRTYERDPTRPDGRDWGAEVAKQAGELFGVSWTWLLQNDGAPTYDAAWGVPPEIRDALADVPQEKRGEAVDLAVRVIRALTGQ